MFFTHQAFYQDDFRNGVLLTWLNPSNGVAGIGYHRISVWTRKYLELSLLRSVYNNVIVITTNKMKITFDECSMKKKLSHFTYSQKVWLMQSRYTRLIRHRYKRLSKYVHNKQTFTSCDNPLPNKSEFYFNKNYQSLRSLFFNSQFVLLSRFRTDEDSAAIAIV